MANGLQIFNADGSVAVDTTQLSLARVIHDQVFAGDGPFSVAPAGFDRTKPGHMAMTVLADGYSEGFYSISYPTNNSVQVSGWSSSSAGVRLLVLTA